MNILVTGGSSGLGEAIVRKLASAGGHRILFSYNSGKENAEKLCGMFPNVSCAQVDFCDAASVDAFAASVSSLDTDVLVNNAWAGSPDGTYFHKTPAEDFLHAFTCNVMPLIKITQACISVMRKKKSGKIINIITSSLISLPPMGYSVYSATKAYIWQLSKCWCRENLKFNITSNCILPDFMDTGFSTPDPRVTEQMTAEHPLKKLLSAEETAGAVQFFVEASPQVNGVSLPLTAGQRVF